MEAHQQPTIMVILQVTAVRLLSSMAGRGQISGVHPSPRAMEAPPSLKAAMVDLPGHPTTADQALGMVRTEAATADLAPSTANKAGTAARPLANTEVLDLSKGMVAHLAGNGVRRPDSTASSKAVSGAPRPHSSMTVMDRPAGIGSRLESLEFRCEAAESYGVL